MKTLAILTITLIASVSSAAHAATPNPPTTVVAYGDLDVSNARGAATLLRRLQGAARLVCSDFDYRGADRALSLRVSLPTLHGECMQQAIDAAVATINRPEFSAYVASVKADKAVYAQVAKR